jgi:uncharacterized damage-inducible protein DinB
MNTQPEPWLRGPVPNIPVVLQPAAHALIAAREDVAAPLDGLTADQLWHRPGGAASIGWHMLHLAGATERLLTYARGEPLTDGQRAALAAERSASELRPSSTELLRLWDETVARALRQLAETREADLPMPRAVGRAQLPATVLGLLFHAAEHATRHVGQIITTAKIIRGARLGPS